MGCSKYIKDDVTVNSYSELNEFINNEGNNLRNDFVFRGLEDSTYELMPSALRKENNKLNLFIDDDFPLFREMSVDYAIMNGFIDKDKISKEQHNILIELDKNGNVINWDFNKSLCDDPNFQIEKELYALFKFLDFADRAGLKVTDNFEVRRNIHNYSGYKPQFWPEEKFIELMSLAQHYGVPTRLLDWSYDYKSALYFALKDILEKPRDADGVLWAFNYKLFRNVNNYGPFYNKLQFYRPEYNRNPNLRGQNGLFTYIVENVNHLPNISLDEILCNELDGKNEDDDPFWPTGQHAVVANIRVPEDDFLFYRIRIPKDKKPLFLKSLYDDGYSEEFLFPGYGGVVKAMKNRVKLNELK